MWWHGASDTTSNQQQADVPLGIVLKLARASFGKEICWRDCSWAKSEVGLDIFFCVLIWEGCWNTGWVFEQTLECAANPVPAAGTALPHGTVFCQPEGLKSGGFLCVHSGGSSSLHL